MKLRTTSDIVRIEEDWQYGTFGVLLLDRQVFCVTLEPPDYENARTISSIPAQQYICERVVSPRFGETFEIRRVPGRRNVLFHAGNVAADTEGCVVVAEHYGKLRGNRAVLNSGATFRAFMDALTGIDLLHLTIRECF